MQLRQNVWFMHDGGPVYYSVAVHEHVNESYPHPWIDRDRNILKTVSVSLIVTLRLFLYMKPVGVFPSNNIIKVS